MFGRSQHVCVCVCFYFVQFIVHLFIDRSVDIINQDDASEPSHKSFGSKMFGAEKNTSETQTQTEIEVKYGIKKWIGLELDAFGKRNTHTPTVQ